MSRLIEAKESSFANLLALLALSALEEVSLRLETNCPLTLCLDRSFSGSGCQEYENE